MRSTIVALLAATALAMPAAAADLFPTKVLASYKTGASLEGLTSLADGTIILTSNFDRKLLKLSPSGELTSFADMPLYPQVVVATPTGFLVSGHGVLPFKDGKMPTPTASGGLPPDMPDFHNLQTQLLVLDPEGHVTRSIAGPADAFFNGLATGSGLVLMADSTTGRIWSADVTAGTVTPWMTDEGLAPAPGRPFPGANGLKIRNGTVYVSNTTRNALYTVKIGADGKPDGPLKPLATIPSADDFDVAADGTVFIPSQGAIASVSPDGTVRMGDKNCEGCDAALLHDSEHTLLLVTHGRGVGRVIQAATGK